MADTCEGAMADTMLPDCKNCGLKAKSSRATLCKSCFLKQSRNSGARTSGNKEGNPGNAGPTKRGVQKRPAGPAGHPSNCVKAFQELWGEKRFQQIVNEARKRAKRDPTAAKAASKESPTK